MLIHCPLLKSKISKHSWQCLKNGTPYRSWHVHLTHCGILWCNNAWYGGDVCAGAPQALYPHAAQISRETYNMFYNPEQQQPSGEEAPGQHPPH